MTFSTGYNVNNSVAEECMMAAWDVSSLGLNATPFYTKGEDTIEFKNCRFPAIF